MRYCTRCILPDTRPNLVLDAEGVCSACRSQEHRPAVDWAAREAALRQVFAHAQAHATGHDCLIPVSGGKDSTWQTLKCLEYGLKPLCVTWRTPARTPLGQQNLDNLISLGVDHLDYTINPEVERRFMYEALVRHGSTGIPMHMAIFNLIPKLACALRIPLIVWGENSAFEYGNPADVATGFELDAAWLRKYGVTHGTSAADWVGPELSAKDLTPYFGPTAAELAAFRPKAIFLGYYLPWDVELTRDVALAHGFRTAAGQTKTGTYDYADIDCDFISIHHYFKWFKFGFTRAFDNLSLEIRRGRLTRDQAIAILRQRGDDTPHGDIAKLCAFLRIAPDHFWQIAERYRNPAVWTRDHGVWQIRDFLIPDWSWA
jgi:N-acetyl sugar amidotransferase